MKYYLAVSTESSLQTYFRNLVDIFDYYRLDDSLVYLKANYINQKSVDFDILHKPLESAQNYFRLGKKCLVLYITTKDYYLSGNPAYDFQRYIVIHEMDDQDQK